MDAFSQPLPTNAMLAAIAWMYLLTNAARIVTYVPQVLAVWRCSDGARSIALLTWGTWTLSHVAAILYGTLVIFDLPMVFIAAINLLGCGAVTGVAMHRRRTPYKPRVPLHAEPVRR